MGQATLNSATPFSVGLLVRVSIPVIKHRDQTAVEEMVNSAYSLQPILRKAKAGTEVETLGEHG